MGIKGMRRFVFLCFFPGKMYPGVMEMLLYVFFVRLCIFCLSLVWGHGGAASISFVCVFFRLTLLVSRGGPLCGISW